MGAHRMFAPITVPAEAGRRRVHRIICSECKASHDVSANTYGGSRNIEDLLRVFARGGWEVGKSSSADLCPSCSAEKRKAKRTRPDAPKHTAEVIQMSSVTKPAAPEPEPPVEMGRDDRRIIFAKLDEVYLSAEVGYSAGWTDKRIAADLGVPRGWVEAVRDEMFGPARDNEDIRALRADFGAMQAEIAPLAQRVDTLLAQAKTASVELIELRNRCERLAKRIAEIEAHVIP